MKNWTQACQELAYLRTGKVFSGSEWIATSDRGTAILAMATQRGDAARIVLKAFDFIFATANRMAESFRHFQQMLRDFAAPPSMLTGETGPSNYAAAFMEGRSWSRRSFLEDRPALIAPHSMPVVISGTS